MAVESADAPVAGARRALLGLRVALALFSLGALIGGPWDMLWHMQSAFESFWSPPHLFIYGMTAAAVAVAAVLAARPPLRAAFGPTIKVPGIRPPLPASLVFLGLGLGVVILSGVLDEIWHAAFGLDETRFSAPHAMFGWGLFVAIMGFGSARLSLEMAGPAPIGRLEAFTFAFLTIAFSLYAFLLAFLVYPTEETVRAISGLPAIASQPGAAHTFRIYEAFGVDRSHPIFAVLSAAWAACAIRTAGLYGEAKWLAPAAAGVASALYAALWFAFAARLGTAGDYRAWAPLPLFPAMLVLMLAGRWRRSDALSVGAAAATVGLLCIVLWPPYTAEWNRAGVALVAVTAVLAFAAAWSASARVEAAVVKPSARRALWPPLGAGLGFPLLFGVVDLFMRSSVA